MKDVFIFSGFGTSIGDYIITNSDLMEAINRKQITGFNEEKIKKNREYIEYIQLNPEKTPFDFFVGNKMGFLTRYWVCPFPPHPGVNYKNAVDLSVNAINLALMESNIHPEQIGMWIISTVSSAEEAPGLASIVKNYFVKSDNKTPTRTLTAGCPGYLEGVRTALDAFTWNPQIEHIVVAHTDIMSKFLFNEKNFIPLATFGDACGATVISRIKRRNPRRKYFNETIEGIILGLEHQDPLMINHLGVKDNRFYINPSIIKERAIENMATSCVDLLKKLSLKSEDIDFLVPHQTGNKILYDLTKKLEIPLDKLFIDVQKLYGNISGASIPHAFSLLHKANKLKKGTKVLSPSAGVGGEYVSMIYIVPEKNNFSIAHSRYIINNDLIGKKVFITGSTSSIGSIIARELYNRGAELILHYNSNEDRIHNLINELSYRNLKVISIKANFCNKKDVNLLIKRIEREFQELDYIIHTAGLPGSIAKASETTDIEREVLMQVNYLHPIEITLKLMKKVKPFGKVLYLGSIAEDYQFAGSAAYVSSKKALHGSAASISDELYKAKISSLYYMIGLTSSGMGEILNPKQIDSIKMLMNGNKLLDATEVSNRIVDSLYKGCVANTNDYPYENKLQVRRDGYRV